MCIDFFFKYIDKCRSYNPHKVNLNVRPSTLTLPLSVSKETFRMTLVFVTKNKCAIFFKTRAMFLDGSKFREQVLKRVTK